jgi:hypothetical protein
VRLSKNAQLILYAASRGYRVLRNGDVVSKTGRRLVQVRCNPHGYVGFTVQNRRKGLKGKIPTHRMQAFQLFGKAVFAPGVHVRHLNNNKLDNAKKNICLGTASQNSMDRQESTRLASARTAASKRRKLSDSRLARLRNDRARGVSLSKLAKKYGVSKTAVSYIVNGKTYAA